MMTATHVSFAGVAYLLLFDFVAKYVPNPSIGFILVIIGALIPDITWMLSYATRAHGFHNSLVHTCIFGLGAAYLLNTYKFSLLHIGAGLLVFSMAVWALTQHKKRLTSLIADSVCIVGYFFLLYYLVLGNSITLTRYPFIEIAVPVIFGMLSNMGLDMFSTHYGIKIFWPFGPTIAIPILGGFTPFEVLFMFAITYALFVMIGLSAVAAGGIALVLSAIGIIPLTDTHFQGT